MRRSAVRMRPTIAALLVVGAVVATGFAAPAVRLGSPVASGSLSIAEENLAAARAALTAGTGPAIFEENAATPAASSHANPYFWTNITGLIGAKAPPAVLYSQMAWDAADGSVLLFGGELSGGSFLNETWSYANGTWTNLTSSILTSPPATAAGGMAYDASTQSVILFGGASEPVGDINYTWAYHAGAWTNLTSSLGTSPSARIVPSLASDSSAGEVLLFGGFSRSGQSLNDTWTFRDDVWTNLTATADFTAFAVNPQLCDDPAAGGVLLSGVATNLSSHSGTVFPITFVFTGTTWENLTATNPQAPTSLGEIPSSLGFLPYGQEVELYSATVIDAAGDLVVYPVEWTFANSLWTNITGQRSLPAAVILAGAAADPVDSTLLLYSGERLVNAVIVNDTFLLSAPPAVQASASRTVVDAGQTVAFTGSVQAGAGPNSPSWSFGDGTTSGTLSTSHSFAHAGLYAVNLTVSDLVGESGSASAPVYVNPSPTVTIAAPSSPTASAALVLVASVAGGTAPFTYSWTLGDGTTATSSQVDHTYSSSGSYLVALTITDAAGEHARANLTLSVGAAITPFYYTSGPGLALLALVIVFAAIAAVFAVLYLRGRRRERPPPAAYTPATAAAAGVPPPGARGPVGPASGGPPPPWSEGPPPGSPPG